MPSVNLQSDIILAGDGTEYHFRFLEWDTDFFGISSYFLDTDNYMFKCSEGLRSKIELELKKSFVTAKIGMAYGKEVIHFLQSAGFAYIITEFVLRLNFSGHREVINRGDIIIDKLTENISLPYEELGSAFTYTRFHSDTRISRQTADLLWIEYIRNYKPSPQRHIFVARSGREIAGAILVNEDDSEKQATLCFVAVIDRFKGRGVGAMMVNYIANCFRGYSIRTETQSRNLGALNFYIKNGFSIVEDSKVIMHRWDT
ncbi:MAG: GNAT family N-acetyltransferase [Nitrospirae bacterium]|nr:GNAT family N-acetyltransferase [Nitrospirota bacterium]